MHACEYTVLITTTQVRAKQYRYVHGNISPRDIDEGPHRPHMQHRAHTWIHRLCSCCKVPPATVQCTFTMYWIYSVLEYVSSQVLAYTTKTKQIGFSLHVDTCARIRTFCIMGFPAHRILHAHAHLRAGQNLLKAGEQNSVIADSTNMCTSDSCLPYHPKRARSEGCKEPWI